VSSPTRIVRYPDLGFRLGTGFFAFLIVLIVAGIAFELSREAVESINKFGLSFWKTETWDPVAGEFGALPFIWGTLYSSILALVIAAPVALGIAVFLSELCPARLQQPIVFLTELLAAIPSIVYGLWGVFVLVPAVRAIQVATPDFLRGVPLFSGPPVGVDQTPRRASISKNGRHGSVSTRRRALKPLNVSRQRTSLAPASAASRRPEAMASAA